MLDIGWWELFVMGMVALLVVGPKELPTLLRTIGRYVGMIKRQADEFRSQFDEAMRESEFSELKKEMDEMRSDVSSSIDDAKSSIKKELDETDFDWDDEEPIKPAPEFADAEETTSFTMPDGEVITKAGTEPPPQKTAQKNGSGADSGGADKASIPAKDTPVRVNDVPAHGGDNAKTADGAASEDKSAMPRDAEAVR